MFSMTANLIVPNFMRFGGVKISSNFHENFDTSESHEIWYNEVRSHAEHESGFNFLIIIISNPISPLLT